MLFLFTSLVWITCLGAAPVQEDKFMTYEIKNSVVDNTLVSISRPEVIIESNVEKNLHMVINCTSQVPHAYCNWISPFGRECPTQNNCIDEGIEVHDTNRTCFLMLNVNKTSDFSGQWQCHLTDYNGKLLGNPTIFLHKFSNITPQTIPILTYKQIGSGKFAFTCEFDSPAPLNVLTWAINEQIYKTATFHQPSPTRTLRSNFSVDATDVEKYFAKNLSCTVVRTFSNGSIIHITPQAIEHAYSLTDKSEVSQQLMFNFEPEVASEYITHGRVVVRIESWPPMSRGSFTLTNSTGKQSCFGTFVCLDAQKPSTCRIKQSKPFLMDVQLETTLNVASRKFTLFFNQTFLNVAPSNNVLAFEFQQGAVGNGVDSTFVEFHLMSPEQKEVSTTTLSPTTTTDEPKKASSVFYIAFAFGVIIPCLCCLFMYKCNSVYQKTELDDDYP